MDVKEARADGGGREHDGSGAAAVRTDDLTDMRRTICKHGYWRRMNITFSNPESVEEERRRKKNCAAGHFVRQSKR